jgi:hypothetical protein
MQLADGDSGSGMACCCIRVAKPLSEKLEEKLLHKLRADNSFRFLKLGRTCVPYYLPRTVRCSSIIKHRKSTEVRV